MSNPTFKGEKSVLFIAIFLNIIAIILFALAIIQEDATYGLVAALLMGLGVVLFFIRMFRKMKK